jgi:hypothetical protein
MEKHLIDRRIVQMEAEGVKFVNNGDDVTGGPIDYMCREFYGWLLSRGVSQEEVFWIGANDDVSSVARSDSINAGRWSTQFGIANRGSVGGGSPLISVSRSPAQEEVFWIGANGDVSRSARNDGLNNGNWLPQAGLAVPASVRAGSPVMVLSRAPSLSEVFWIGANGDVSTIVAER